MMQNLQELDAVDLLVLPRESGSPSPQALSGGEEVEEEGQERVSELATLEARYRPSGAQLRTSSRN